MNNYNCIFLDRDGTLNSDPGYISSLDDFSFFDFTIQALKKIAESGNQFCIITNQSGISRGLIEHESLDEIHSFIKKEFQKNQIPLLDIYVCHTNFPRKESVKLCVDSYKNKKDEKK